MELIEFNPTTQACVNLPYREVVLFPISDLQYGAPGCDLDGFKRWIDYGMQLGAYFYGLGDFLDVASPTGREKIAGAKFYDSVTEYLEGRAYKDLDILKTVLKGTEGRWLFMLEGHHFYKFENGDHSDKLLANYLGCPFLGTSTICQLRFQDENGGGSSTCQIWAHHGVGSGQTMAAPLNKLEKIMSRFPSVDIFTMGHYHRAVGYPVDTLIPTFGKHPRLKSQRKILACTGGWLKGYVVGNERGGTPQGSYIEKGAMSPTNLGGIILRVRPVKKRDHRYIWTSIEL